LCITHLVGTIGYKKWYVIVPLCIPILRGR